MDQCENFASIYLHNVGSKLCRVCLPCLLRYVRSQVSKPCKGDHAKVPCPLHANTDVALDDCFALLQEDMDGRCEYKKKQKTIVKAGRVTASAKMSHPARRCRH